MNNFDTVVAFGDSFSSQCGTIYNEATAALEVNRRTWTDFKSGLWGNPIFDDCSVNGGLNYLNYLTNCTKNGVDPMTCPTRLIALAFGGAEASPGLNHVESDIVPLEGQMLNWAKHVKPHLDFSPDRTLVSFFYGLNDLTILKEEGYAELLAEGDIWKIELEITRRISSIQQSMSSLYADGLRHFLVFNVPLDISGVAALILEWNRLLELQMSAFKAAHANAVLYMMDTFALNNQMSGQPEAYGLTDTSNACFSELMRDSAFDCSATSAFLKMDWIHWTPRAHVILSDAVTEMMLMHTSATSPGSDTVGGSNIDITLYKIKTTVMDNSLAAIALLTGISVISLLTLFYKFYRRLSGKSVGQRRSDTRSTRYAQVPTGMSDTDIEMHNNDTEMDTNRQTD